MLSQYFTLPGPIHNFEPHASQFNFPWRPLFWTLGDRRHYREDLSDVVNIFGTDGKGDRSHFNRLAVISRVLSAAGDVSERGKGYVPISLVIHDCETVGMTAETASSVIGLLIEKRILATDTLIRDTYKEDCSIRATAAALYYVTELGLDFTYIDNLIIDMEIGRDDVRQDMRDLSRQVFSEDDRFKRLEIRIERARRFIAYLKEEFRTSKFSEAGPKFDNLGKVLVDKIADGFRAQSDAIIANARRAFGRPANDLFHQA